MSKILNGILIGLAVPVTAIGTACAVPQSREYLADKIAELASPKYAETLDLNKTQQTTIEELQEKQTELSNKLTNLQNEYDSLNSKLSSVQLDLTNALNEKAAIENELNSTKQSIATLNASIATLSSQKATLLDAITEIDNSINNTEDETEIENLEEKKESILQQIEVLNDEINNLQAENATLTTNQQTLENQISSLNTTISDLRSQVATLEVDKASLEVQISTLESEKVTLENQLLEYKMNYATANVVVDTTNSALESIVIRDDLTGMDYSLNNLDTLTNFKMTRSQKVTITYAQTDDNLSFVVVNGSTGDSNTKTISSDLLFGFYESIYTGETFTITVSSITESQLNARRESPGLYKHNSLELVTSWDDLILKGNVVVNDGHLTTSNITNGCDLVCGTVDNLTDMSDAFSGTYYIDLFNLDTSKVVNMSHAFERIYFTQHCGLENLDTSSVTNMSKMFYKCNFKSVSNDLSKFDTSKVTDMSRMFYGCSGDIQSVVNILNTTNVVNMYQMFRECYATSLDLTNFNTSNVTDMSYMFCGCHYLTDINLSSFNTSNVTNMMCMFTGDQSLTKLDISNFDMSNVKSIVSMFSQMTKLVNLNVGTFDASSSNLDNRYVFTKSADDQNVMLTITYDNTYESWQSIFSDYSDISIGTTLRCNDGDYFRTNNDEFMVMENEDTELYTLQFGKVYANGDYYFCIKLRKEYHSNTSKPYFIISYRNAPGNITTYECTTVIKNGNTITFDLDIDIAIKLLSDNTIEIDGVVLTAK